MDIVLEFAQEQAELQRRRLRYAFCLFCAIYGHRPIFDSKLASSAAARITYGLDGSSGSNPPTLHLPPLHHPRSLSEQAPPPKPFERCDERTFVFHSPSPGREPDWLGEIFEWVSCADEYSISKRDSVGRIPFAASYMGRHKLDPHRPYAAIAMHFLQQKLRDLVPGSNSELVSPAPSFRHFVICTHDVDFLPLTRAGCVRRLLKNAGISLLAYRSPRLGLNQTRKAFSTMLGGKNPLDQVSSLADSEVYRALSASYFFLADRQHRRDGNYAISEPTVVELMRFLERHGMEIGVHGSYKSLDESQTLNSQFTRLRGLGFRPEGGRQHWLRFTMDRLINSCENANVSYDASVGWPDCTGFRAGACFAFPPYNFTEERPSTFLEIPLVIMDGCLVEPGTSEADWYDRAASVLSESRRWGWGGVSVLWHPNGFGGGQLPPGVGNVFWRLIGRRRVWGDTWISAGEFVGLVRRSYAEVGLLATECARKEADENSTVARVASDARYGFSNLGPPHRPDENTVSNTILPA